MVLKKLLLSLCVIGALVISQVASADSRSHRRGFSDYGYGHNNYRNSYRNNYRRHGRVNSYHYGARDRSYDRRYRSGFTISYGNYYPRNRRYDSGIFVGGLVLGSLLSYPRYSSRNHESVVYRTPPVTRTREIIYVDNSSSRSATPVASGRRLLRDLEGNCFERIVDEQGNEIRVQLEAEQCNF
jgi:hypothetical protein